MLQSSVQDLLYAFRSMRKSPGFTAAAVLSLALGIGANAAIFTFINAALLAPLPYPHADRIVALLQRPPAGGELTPVHPRSFVPWRDRARSFEALTIAQAIPVNTEGLDGAAEQVSGLWATSEVFRVFGVLPFLGRTFTDEEGFSRSAVRGESVASSPVVVLSHAYWQRRFGSELGVLGKAIRIGRGTASVVGVMPAGFRIATLDVDVYFPLPLDRSRPEAVGSRSFQCYGLLRPGATIQASQAEMAVLADQVGRQDPSEKNWGVVVISLRDYLVRDNRRVLFALFGVVAVVLGIACANVAGLLLARGVGRRSELALRASLGASRGRLVQQLLVESVALAALGGALGALFGSWSAQVLSVMARDEVAFGQLRQAQLDPRVLGFTFALSVLTAIVFGLAPAWQASRFDLQAAIKEQGRGAGEGGRQQRLRAALVVGEVALAVVLLVGAGLLLRSVVRLLRVELGFEPEQVITLRTFLTGPPQRRAALVEGILDRVETLPEVGAAGTIQFLPLSGMTNDGPFRFLGRPAPADPRSQESDVSTVSRGYFAAMGIPVVRGRPFDRREQMESPRTALVNQAFVRKYCPNEDPIGLQIIGDWANPKPTEIIGVVGDIRHNGLSVAPRPTVFLAQAQVPGYITYLVVRTSAEPARLAAAIRREVQSVDPLQPLTAIQPMQHYVTTALARPRLYASLLAVFAGLALLLAAVGLYGLMAYTVGRRTHEIGVRMALGAAPRDVLRSMLRQGATLVLGGLVLGIALALVSSRLIGKLLYGVGTTDLGTYTAVVALLGLVALIAAYLPARRAARIDPLSALRNE
jgi:predicted permease